MRYVEIYDLFCKANYGVFQYVTLFQDFLQPIVTSETRSVSYLFAICYVQVCMTLLSVQVPYTDCSTTTGVLSLDPYELRLSNATPGEIYGNGGTFYVFPL